MNQIFGILSLGCSLPDVQSSELGSPNRETSVNNNNNNNGITTTTRTNVCNNHGGRTLLPTNTSAGVATAAAVATETSVPPSNHVIYGGSEVTPSCPLSDLSNLRQGLLVVDGAAENGAGGGENDV